ncbi:MAG: outer membrane protein assembly factor BamD [Deltaproteobacteria bacterium]|nr:outer membrane protein assembly factor BamD [Deltaproteobacteria bacterium]
MRSIPYSFSLLFILAGLALVCPACGGGSLRPPTADADAELNYCLKLSAKKKYEEAVECLEIYKSRHRADSRAADADLLIGDSYFRQKEYLLAAETYKQFLERYPSHPKADYAYYKTGLAYLEDTPKAIDRDQQYLQSAVQSFAIVPKYFPGSPYAKLAEQKYAEARSKQARRHFYVARFYYKYGEYKASIPRFVTIIDEYPKSGLDEKSFYYLTLSCVKTNEMDKARQVVSAFEQRYPESPWLKKAKGKIKGV